MAAKYWRAVVSLGTQTWVQNGFATKAAALKAASVYASKHRRKATGFRAEPE